MSPTPRPIPRRIREGVDPLRLAGRVGRAAAVPRAARLLLLDVDGTLAPIAPTPEAARVPEGTLAALRRLSRGGWIVALISGRPRDQVKAMVPVAGARWFGSHGLEGSWTGRARRPAKGLERRLATLRAELERLAREHADVRIEPKPAGLAIHDRRLSGAALRAWQRELSGWLGEQDLQGLEVLTGKRVVELRPRGVHKGLVAAAAPRPRGGPNPDPSWVAMGDDRTDEDLFAAVREGGLGVLVGPPRRTAARERLASPRSVERFLVELAAGD